MKLLICTQVVDKDDPSLSFFHRWLEVFARSFEHITVICLREGVHALPANVTVLSLGKERGRVSRLRYLLRFYRYVWHERHLYDTVFVHMNQEYVLLGGWLWWCLRKPVYMWRNHYAGSWLTDVASWWCVKVFCTSRASYTARYAKTVLMPVGVDDCFFKAETTRIPRSVLFYGRLTPSKHPEVFIEALRLLLNKGILYTASVYGPTAPKDETFVQGLLDGVRKLKLEDRIVFHGGVPFAQGPAVFAAHDIYVNLAGTGMYDKTLFEAAAAGCIVVAVSRDFADLAGQDYVLKEGNAVELAVKLEVMLSSSAAAHELLRTRLQTLAREHTIAKLAARLVEEM